MLKIELAESAEQIELARALMREYSDATKAEPCFRTFEAELANLPGEYAPPGGRLYVVFEDEHTAGCCAFRKFAPGACELKRMYVRPAFRGMGIGRQLAVAAIEDARALGYDRMYLDTLPSMQSAIALYRALGFRLVEPYMQNPIPGALCFELEITGAVARALPGGEPKTRMSIR